jgi:hypothetical protein
MSKKPSKKCSSNIDKINGVRSTLILSFKEAKGRGGIPHTGVPEIVHPPSAFSLFE